MPSKGIKSAIKKSVTLGVPMTPLFFDRIQAAAQNRGTSAPSLVRYCVGRVMDEEKDWRKQSHAKNLSQ